LDLQKSLAVVKISPQIISIVEKGKISNCSLLSITTGNQKEYKKANTECKFNIS